MVLALAVLAALSLIAYAPVFSQPFIADDYQQIDIGRSWGPPSGWAELASEPLFRCRTTSILLTHWTEELFGVSRPVLYGSSVLLHIVNVWLILALGFWDRIGWKISFAAAAFFAVYEGHQEAVMWYAALHELVMFLFAVCFVLAWVAWLRTGSRFAWAGAAAAFILALFSKEPAAVLPVVALLIGCWEGRSFRSMALALLPFALVDIAYVVAIFLPLKYHQHLTDGTFSLHAPFLLTWVRSYARLMWVWGLIGLAWLFWSGGMRRYGSLVKAGAIWIAVTLPPFCFLTYMNVIPSRHTYFPSVGLALMVGAAFIHFREWVAPRSRFAAVAVATILVAQHSLYLWLVKRPQYLKRAEPTQALLTLVREGRTPVQIHCFPYNPDIARLAVEIELHTKARSVLIYSQDAPNKGCPVGTFEAPATRSALGAQP